MARAGDVIELTPGERLVLVTTTVESDGELLAMEAHYAAGGQPSPEHYHPRQEERFTGVGGTVSARVGGVQRTIGPGDQLTIPAGVSHAFWNPGGDEVVLRWEVRPALRTERMFEELAAAGSTFHKAFVVPRYREEFRLSSALQRTLLDVLASGARLIGLAR